MRRLLIFTAFLSSISCFAQSAGDGFWEEGKLEKAMFAYGAEFMGNPTNAQVAYKLSATLSLVNEVDTAFFFLNAALANDNSLNALVDADLYNLSKHAKWELIEERQLQKFQAENGSFSDPKLTKRLLRMIMRDQALKYQLHKTREYYQKNGYMPHWGYAVAAMKGEINKDNLAEFATIAEQFGWPTYSQVGELAADAMLLVVNHHPEDEFRKAYLPKIKEACLAGEGSCMEYAKIQDRVLVNEGSEQLYGMQFRYNSERKLEPFPIVNPTEVDKRRMAIGLEPLALYLKRKIDYDWTVEQKGN